MVSASSYLCTCQTDIKDEVSLFHWCTTVASYTGFYLKNFRSYSRLYFPVSIIPSSTFLEISLRLLVAAPMELGASENVCSDGDLYARHPEMRRYPSRTASELRRGVLRFSPRSEFSFQVNLTS